ncbi:MAG: L-serine ammonia-lyase [Bacteroidota bacterium]
MESIKEVYRIGIGPSSSHTMGPRRAAEIFKSRNPFAASFRVTLYGSLAATGKGHLTDEAIIGALSPWPVELLWKPEVELEYHSNGMDFEALDFSGKQLAFWRVYSVGGGTLRQEDEVPFSIEIYELTTLEAIIEWADSNHRFIWELVAEREGKAIWDYLSQVWRTMQAAIERGINAEGILPGGLNLQRKSHSFYLKHQTASVVRPKDLLFAYALAVAEENAAGNEIVTAPTSGSCGVLPAVLKYLQVRYDFNDDTILQALATAGLIGNLVKTNGSISGAEVGCQGEIGTACAMAAGAAAQLLGGTPRQIEYAAEIGFEHHLGLTCDPVAGLVQIPCIERNAFAASRAVDCAEYALLSDGQHRITFDQVVRIMTQTGKDLKSCYRETSFGGLALLNKP